MFTFFFKRAVPALIFMSIFSVLPSAKKGDFWLMEKDQRTSAEAPKVVALTFDDGPDAVVTPAVLDVLKKYEVKATFFFIGKKLEANRDVVLRASSEGHAIFNHTFNHEEALTKLTPEQVAEELTSTQALLESMVGPTRLLFRPPYGALNLSVLTTSTELGYRAILWSIDTLDWKSRNKEAITETVVGKITPGDIILMHSREGTEATPEALPGIIEWIKGQGYSFVRIGDTF